MLLVVLSKVNNILEWELHCRVKNSLMIILEGATSYLIGHAGNACGVPSFFEKMKGKKARRKERSACLPKSKLQLHFASFASLLLFLSSSFFALLLCLASQLKYKMTEPPVSKEPPPTSPKQPDIENDVTDSREIWAAGIIQVQFWGN